MLEQIFSKVVDMSLGAGMIIIIVFIVRLLLKRFPKYITYMLWSVVLFRLLCPFTFESKISIVPDLKPAFYEYALEKDDVLAEASGDFAVPYTGGEGKNVSEAAPITPSQSQPDRNNVKDAAISWQELFILFGKYVWISGIGAMLLYSVISFVKIRNKVRVSIPFKENILITDEPVTPFVMGIFHPKIYLPGCLSEKEQEYIILHEKFHIRRFDHIVKPVAFATLCLHWFNPLVWIAFTLFCKDMEMSCDAAVIKKLGENIRADYSASLLALSTQHGIVRGLPVEFGEGDTRSRVKNLAAFRKTKKGVLVVLTAGVIILIVCLASTHKTSISGENGSKDQIHGYKNEVIKTSILKERPGNHTGESIEEGDTSEVQESKYTNEEIKKLFFGEWKVSKLLGFSEVQNDYSNYPEGHDIIGNHILINENAFSSEGLATYERYQCKVSNPTYEVSDIKYDYPIYYVNESVKEETELYNMIMNEEFQELEIKGNYPSAVQIMVSSDNQLVILTMDGAYYLLEKIQ